MGCSLQQWSGCARTLVTVKPRTLASPWRHDGRACAGTPAPKVRPVADAGAARRLENPSSAAVASRARETSRRNGVQNGDDNGLQGGRDGLDVEDLRPARDHDQGLPAQSSPRLRELSPSLTVTTGLSATLRGPTRPSRGVGWRVPRHQQGFPCCVQSPLPHMPPPIPRRRKRSVLASLASRPLAAFPVSTAGRLPR